VLLAILKLSGGDVDRLRELVKTACNDFRDVIAPAEYPRMWAIGLVAAEKMNCEAKKRLIEDDWTEYQEWLNREYWLGALHIASRGVRPESFRKKKNGAVHQLDTVSN
jgi:hypothetical protein